MCSDGGELNLENMLWAPGVDYVGSWREAQNAGRALLAAIMTACPDTEDATAVALSGPDGLGIIQLRLPAATARALAELIRAATASRDTQRNAS